MIIRKKHWAIKLVILMLQCVQTNAHIGILLKYGLDYVEIGALMSFCESVGFTQEVDHYGMELTEKGLAFLDRHLEKNAKAYWKFDLLDEENRALIAKINERRSDLSNRNNGGKLTEHQLIRLYQCNVLLKKALRKL